jgi:hypothetical protein
MGGVDTESYLSPNRGRVFIIKSAVQAPLSYKHRAIMLQRHDNDAAHASAQQ